MPSNTPESDQDSGSYEFVSPSTKFLTEDGLIGFGADLKPKTLLTAYSQGAFPWFNEGDPLAWWCPPVRSVLRPSNFTPSKSLVKHLNKTPLRLSLNTSFEQVVDRCASTREDTWITQPIQEAYTELHRLGVAHSVEVWHEHKLVGGLYGLKLGSLFCGESMFHTQANASKVAFWGLSALCLSSGVSLIDGQLPNPHLDSLGFESMNRTRFLAALPTLINNQQSWKLTPLPEPHALVFARFNQ